MLELGSIMGQEQKEWKRMRDIERGRERKREKEKKSERVDESSHKVGVRTCT